MLTLAEVKAKNKAAGRCWFTPETMKFWNSKVHGEIRYGRYFITSEDNYDRSKRMFTIRSFDDNGKIDTVGKYQPYSSLEAAEEALEGIVKGSSHEE